MRWSGWFPLNTPSVDNYVITELQVDSSLLPLPLVYDGTLFTGGEPLGTVDQITLAISRCSCAGTLTVPVGGPWYLYPDSNKIDRVVFEDGIILTNGTVERLVLTRSAVWIEQAPIVVEA